MACEELVAGCFLDENTPMAVPELNRERTLKYLECCYRQATCLTTRTTNTR